MKKNKKIYKSMKTIRITKDKRQKTKDKRQKTNKRRIFKGGLDNFKLPNDSINNFNYIEFDKYLKENNITYKIDTQLDISHYIIDKNKPFILYKKRREWIAHLYPYGEYIINIFKNINWNELSDILEKDKVTPNISIQYYFFGGCNIELYNKYYKDLEDLNNYISPTADIDIGLNIFINSTEEIHYEGGIYKEYLLNFIKNKFAIILNILKDVTDDIKIEMLHDRIQIIVKIDDYSDHVLEVLYIFYILRDGDYINLYNSDKFDYLENGIIIKNNYRLRNLWYETFRNSQIICNEKLYKPICYKKNNNLLNIDKTLNRLKRFEWSIRILMKLLVIYDINDELILFLHNYKDQESFLQSYVFILLKDYSVYIDENEKKPLWSYINNTDILLYIKSYINNNILIYEKNIYKYPEILKDFFYIIHTNEIDKDTSKNIIKKFF
jgi:hypothetical protein